MNDDDDDLDRDLRLSQMLDRLPPPPLPADLAARIVQNATGLAQHRDQLAASAEGAPTIIACARRPWRWLPHAIGTAAAASLVAAILLHGNGAEPAAPAGGVQVARNTPAPPSLSKGDKFDAPPVHSAGRARIAPEPTRARKQQGMKYPGNGNTDPGMAVEHRPLPPTDVAPSEQLAPELANRQSSEGKAIGPAEHTFVGPPAMEDPGRPIFQKAPAPGLGITGAGAATQSAVPAPAPPMPSGAGGRVPRF